MHREIEIGPGVLEARSTPPVLRLCGGSPQVVETELGVIYCPGDSVDRV